MTAEQQIRNLIFEYASLVDAGDFAGVGLLLRDATFTGGGAPAVGAEAIEKLLRAAVIIHPDGTPRTKHLTTNVAITVDDEGGATSQSYVTVMQSVSDRPLQAIAVGRYDDRFARREGKWRFAERRVYIDFAGDTSQHLRS